MPPHAHLYEVRSKLRSPTPIPQTCLKHVRHMRAVRSLPNRCTLALSTKYIPSTSATPKIRSKQAKRTSRRRPAAANTERKIRGMCVLRYRNHPTHTERNEPSRPNAYYLQKSSRSACNMSTNQVCWGVPARGSNSSIYSARKLVEENVWMLTFGHCSVGELLLHKKFPLPRRRNFEFCDHPFPCCYPIR